MGELMKSILLMSAAGSVLAFMLLCLRPVTRKLFSPKWQYYIWLAVLIVLVVPIKLSLPAEPVQLAPPADTAVQAQQDTPVQTGQEAAQPPTPDGGLPFFRASQIPANILQMLGFIWLAGALLLLGYKLTKYVLFLRAIRKNSVLDFRAEDMPKRLTVRKTELLDAPLIVGLIKPVLYLPHAEMEQEELSYILLHELTHFRRHDLLYKWFAMLVSSMHWFNPLVYIVSRQIDEECEVSCDYAACQSLTEPQKKGYMAMILDLVQAAVRQSRPLTTQMASSKKTLKRRLLMMKTKKATGKFVSVLSVVLALAMLSTTVFASGVLSGLAEDNYTVEITNNGEVIELVNKPFIENGEVYVPLREMLEKLNMMNNPGSYINWNNGKIEVFFGYNGDGTVIALDDRFEMEIGKKQLIYNPSSDLPNSDAVREMYCAPLLVNQTTCVPYSFISCMLTGEKWDINYAVYGKNGEQIYFSGTSSRYDDTTPEYTVEQFFQHLERGQVEQANMYCVSDSRIDRSFGTQKRVSDITVDYTIDSFGQISAECYAEFIDEEHLADDYQPVHWKIYLVQQPDKTYLINGWESLDV